MNEETTMENFESAVLSYVDVLKKDASYYYNLSKEDSEDLVNDTILAALEKKSFYKKDTNLRGWLRTILRNLYINLYRIKVKRGNILQVLPNFDYESFSPFETDTEVSVEDIYAQIDSMTEKRATLFRLWLEGYSTNEISKKTNTHPNTVRTLIHYARYELRDKLKDEYEKII